MTCLLCSKYWWRFLISSFAVARKICSATRRIRWFIAQSAWLSKQGLSLQLWPSPISSCSWMLMLLHGTLCCSYATPAPLFLSEWCSSRGLLIGKPYSNSLLASLNSRAPIFQIRGTDVVTSEGSVWNSNQQSTFQANEGPVNSIRLDSEGHSTSLFGARVGDDDAAKKEKGINYEV